MESTTRSVPAPTYDHYDHHDHRLASAGHDCLITGISAVGRSGAGVGGTLLGRVGRRRMEHGQSWWDGCRRCFCHDGHEMCALITCPTLRCIKPVLRPDSCCPSCPGKLSLLFFPSTQCFKHWWQHSIVSTSYFQSCQIQHGGRPPFFGKCQIWPHHTDLIHSGFCAMVPFQGWQI